MLSSDNISEKKSHFDKKSATPTAGKSQYEPFVYGPPK